MPRLYGQEARRLQKNAMTILEGHWKKQGVHRGNAHEIAKMQVYGCEPMGFRDLMKVAKELE